MDEKEKEHIHTVIIDCENIVTGTRFFSRQQQTNIICPRKTYTQTRREERENNNYKLHCVASVRPVKRGWVLESVGIN